MAVAEPGTRSFYLYDYSDECVPCDCTLDGWAHWLSKPDESWPHEIAENGQQYIGGATLWLPDVEVTFDGNSWRHSAVPESVTFAAVRFAQGHGWSADLIIYGGAGNDLPAAILDYFSEHDDADIGQIEYVAVGIEEANWRFTFRSECPPRLEAERVQ